jgi:hypothetical protein
LSPIFLNSADVSHSVDMLILQIIWFESKRKCVGGPISKFKSNFMGVAHFVWAIQQRLL